MFNNTFKIKMISQQEQIDFVNKIANIPCDIDLIKGTVVIDAKSLMGVTGVDTTNDCKIMIKTNDESTINEVLQAISVYLSM